MNTTVAALKIQMNAYDEVSFEIETGTREEAFEALLDYTENFGFSANLLKKFAKRFA